MLTRLDIKFVGAFIPGAPIQPVAIRLLNKVVTIFLVYL